MKGKYFKHPERKHVWDLLMMERIRKSPCRYCPIKLKVLLRNDCDYIYGTFNFVYRKYDMELIGVDMRCTHKWSQVGTNYYKWEFRFGEEKNVK